MEVRKDTRAARKAATPRPNTPRKLQLPLSRAARKELRQLCAFARKELRPSTLAAVRTFATQHGYRASDVLEAIVVLAVVNHGESTEVA